MKIVKALTALLLCGVLLTGCVPRTISRPSVWMIVKCTTTDFWQAAFAGASAAKAEYDLDLTVIGPDTEEDYQTQNAYIARAVDQGADAIVLSAISYTGNAEAVRRAVEAGVKIIVIDSDVDSGQVAARIGTDNVQAGAMACQAALDTDLEELHVGIINFDAGVRNGQEREEGFRSRLYEDPRVRQIHTINVLADAKDAEKQTERLLRRHPEINVLVSFNEPLSVGAARAVDKLKLGGKVRLIGFDTNLECIDRLRSGEVSALVVQNPYAMGYLGVETAWKLLQQDNKNVKPQLTTPAVVVSRENMFSPEQQKVLFPFD